MLCLKCAHSICSILFVSFFLLIILINFIQQSNGLPVFYQVIKSVFLLNEIYLFFFIGFNKLSHDHLLVFTEVLLAVYMAFNLFVLYLKLQYVFGNTFLQTLPQSCNVSCTSADVILDDAILNLVGWIHNLYFLHYHILNSLTLRLLECINKWGHTFDWSHVYIVFYVSLMFFQVLHIL